MSTNPIEGMTDEELASLPDNSADLQAGCTCDDCFKERARQEAVKRLSEKKQQNTAKDTRGTGSLGMAENRRAGFRTVLGGPGSLPLSWVDDKEVMQQTPQFLCWETDDQATKDDCDCSDCDMERRRRWIKAFEKDDRFAWQGRCFLTAKDVSLEPTEQRMPDGGVDIYDGTVPLLAMPDSDALQLQSNGKNPDGTSHSLDCCTCPTCRGFRRKWWLNEYPYAPRNLGTQASSTLTIPELEAMDIRKKLEESNCRPVCDCDACKEIDRAMYLQVNASSGITEDKPVSYFPSSQDDTVREFQVDAFFGDVQVSAVVRATSEIDARNVLEQHLLQILAPAETTSDISDLRISFGDDLIKGLLDEHFQKLPEMTCGICHKTKSGNEMFFDDYDDYGDNVALEDRFVRGIWDPRTEESWTSDTKAICRACAAKFGQPDAFNPYDDEFLEVADGYMVVDIKGKPTIIEPTSVT